jgi:hypothetical protein
MGSCWLARAHQLEIDGWSIWQIGDAAEDEHVGGDLAQGMRKWSVQYGRKIEGMAMCPQDNMLAVATR